ncbi:hypothetical protein O181_012664 [Austropuccinia psidii MF-1]|uniref:Uncharacterized protein n=1 Tax=Austropuccinia psidii MF-1 TaxID=1389203 RepID=A0A9Q3BV09_9BASI|nr:hypothetical protein [Austropuccinia psidii MF-1]
MQKIKNTGGICEGLDGTSRVGEAKSTSEDLHYAPLLNQAGTLDLEEFHPLPSSSFRRSDEPQTLPALEGVGRIDHTPAIATSTEIQRPLKYFLQNAIYLNDSFLKQVQRLKTPIFFLTYVLPFEKKFGMMSVSGKCSLLTDTFKSFSAKDVSPTEIELKMWIQSIAKVMHSQESDRIQDLRVEIQVLVELSNHLIWASKAQTNSPQQISLEAFNSLYKDLYTRLEKKPEAWRETNWSEQLPWSKYLLNGEPDLFKNPEKVEALRQELSADEFIGYKFKAALAGANYQFGDWLFKDAVQKLFEIVEDEMLTQKSNQGIRTPPRRINFDTWEKRTAASTALWFLHQAAFRNEAIEFTDASRHYIIHNVFFRVLAFSDNYLHPHYRQLATSIDAAARSASEASRPGSLGPAFKHPNYQQLPTKDDAALARGTSLQEPTFLDRMWVPSYRSS